MIKPKHFTLYTERTKGQVSLHTFVGFFVCGMVGRFGYEKMANNFKRIYWVLL